jgi:hypothetical protein
LLQAELIRLYLNHRPALPLDKALIGTAFETICDAIADGGNQLSWDQLRAALAEEGEAVTPEDLDAYLVELTGAGADGIPGRQVLDAKLFAEHVLGFEDFSN